MTIQYFLPTSELFAREIDGTYRRATVDEVTTTGLTALQASFSQGAVMKSPEAVKSYLKLKIARLEYEVFGCIAVDTQHQVIDILELARGTVNAAAVYPREVVKTILKLNAGAVIFFHNHPSGIAEPSEADRQLTRRLQEVLLLIEVRSLDHFVIGGNTTVSFAERGWM